MGIEKIEKYLEDTGITKTELAAKCRISLKWLIEITKGRKKISPYIADSLSYYTKGKIVYEELTDEPRPKGLRRMRY